MKKKNIFGMILAGGGGTRLWPLSHDNSPKQFLSLTEDKSLLQLTYQRLNKFISAENILTVTNQAHVDIVKSQLGPDHKAIGEPMGKNTAPAIALGMKHIQKQAQDDPIILVCPSDHLIKNESSFVKKMQEATLLAEKGFLVIFGIKPTRPETGYGYVNATSKTFKEKPDYDTALKYLQYGDYYWNGGIFMFKLSTMLQELNKYMPEIIENIDDYEKLPSISIDYAVMEKTDKLMVVPVDCGWNDLGSWEAVYDVLDKTKDKNAKKGDVTVLNTKNSLIYSTTKKVAVIGMKDIVIVETEDAVLVCNKNNTQDVKQLVDKIKANKH